MPNFIVNTYSSDSIPSPSEVALEGGGVCWRNNEYQDSEIAYKVALMLNYYHGISELQQKLGQHHPHVSFFTQLAKDAAWFFAYSSDIRYQVSHELRLVALEICKQD